MSYIVCSESEIISKLLFFVCIVGLGLVFLSSMVHAVFFSPRVTSVPQAGNDLVISVNFSGVSAPRMYFKGVDDNGWFVFNISLVNGSCTIPESYFSEGLYEYYFADESGGSRYPDANATFRIALSSGNAAIYHKAIELVNSDPVDSSNYCTPWSGDCSCSYESMQGFMISAFNDAFFMTDNVTFGNKSDKLAGNRIDDIPMYPYETCDHVGNDYNCEDNDSNDPNLDDPNIEVPSGAMRQASMMHALWNRYSVTGNLTLWAMAVNYTNGSAENCGVWGVTPDYDCGNGDDQGFMMYSYFEAFERSGDVTYKQIAANLSCYGLNYSNSDFLMLGFFKAYELTGNVTYKEKAVNLSLERLDSCRYGGCDVYNQSVSAFAMWDAYEKTGDYRYKLSAYDKTVYNFSGSCNPWNSTYSCQNPLEQGAIVQAFFKAYQLLDAGDDKFYSPSVSNNPRRLQPLTINVSFGGILENPMLYYRRLGGTWKSGSISVSDKSYTIPALELAYAGVYEYYFYDNVSSTRYPEDGGAFRLALSSGNDTFRLIAQNFSGHNPSENLCKPLSNEFSCNYESLQGTMIYGYSNSYFSTGHLNYSSIATNFSTARIDVTDFPPWLDDQYATCDHTGNDFDCNTDSPINVPPLNDIPAPLRQGWMIYSLWDAYQKTGNGVIKKTARDYSVGSSEMCDVWGSTPDYDCGNADEQGLMMLAYFKAYEQSGDDVFRAVAENLSSVAMGMNDSDYLVMGLFNAYDMTGNSSYYDKAVNITDSRLDYCVSSGCSVINFSVSALAAWSAYEHTESGVYLSAAINKTLQSPVSSCDPWNTTVDYECEYPDEQGMMMSLYWKADQAYTTSIYTASLNLDLNMPDSVELGDSFNVSCFIENTGSDFLFNVNVSLYFEDGLNTTDNISYFYDNLSVLENRTLNWTFVAVSSGDKFVSCNVTSSAVNASEIKTVVVNAPVDNPPDTLPSGSSSSGGTATVDDIFYDVSYSFSDMNSSSHFFEVISGDALLADAIKENLGIDDNFTEISEISFEISSCYNISRTFESNGSVSKISLSVSYLCSNTTENFIVYDSIPKDFADFSELVIVELSKDGDIFVLQDDPSYMFVFENMSENEVIFVNYTVNKSIRFNLLDYMKRPYVFAERFKAYDDDLAPLLTILFPINNLNVTSVPFELRVSYFDDSGVSCSYSIDGMDFVEMVNDLQSTKSSMVDAADGVHSIFVECRDAFGNYNDSIVVFYVDVEIEDFALVNETFSTYDEGTWLEVNGFSVVVFMFLVVAGLIFYYLYTRAYIAYFLLDGLLRIMRLLDKFGRVSLAFRMYPIMLWLYECLDANAGLKKSLCLRKDIGEIIRVFELCAITNNTYNSVVMNNVNKRKLESSLVLIKRLYDEVMKESLADMAFLDQVRKKYVYCMNYLADRV